MHVCHTDWQLRPLLITVLQYFGFQIEYSDTNVSHIRILSIIQLALSHKSASVSTWRVKLELDNGLSQIWGRLFKCFPAGHNVPINV